jgi:hypothetical protein
MENTYPSQPTKSLTDDEQFELCSLVAYLKLDVSEFTDFELAKRYSKTSGGTLQTVWRPQCRRCSSRQGCRCSFASPHHTSAL